jgi:hypothetical protein
MGSFSGIVIISIQFVIFIDAVYYVPVLKKLYGYSPSQSAVHLASIILFKLWFVIWLKIGLCWTWTK